MPHDSRDVTEAFWKWKPRGKRKAFKERTGKEDTPDSIIDLIEGGTLFQKERPTIANAQCWPWKSLHEEQKDQDDLQSEANGGWPQKWAY